MNKQSNVNSLPKLKGQLQHQKSNPESGNINMDTLLNFQNMQKEILGESSTSGITFYKQYDNARNSSSNNNVPNTIQPTKSGKGIVDENMVEKPRK